MEQFLSLLIKLSLAILLGGALGWQRGKIGKSAGPRTYALVTLGSALFTLLSISAFSGDSGRVASQIITGIGFLGAGLILHRDDGGVLGMTTAAGLWAVAAVGMAIGVGWYWQSILATALIFFVFLAVESKPAKKEKAKVDKR